MYWVSFGFNPAFAILQHGLRTASIDRHRRVRYALFLDCSQRRILPRNMYCRLCRRRGNHHRLGFVHSDTQQNLLVGLGRIRLDRRISYYPGCRRRSHRQASCGPTKWSVPGRDVWKPSCLFRGCHQRRQCHHLCVCWNSKLLQYRRGDARSEGLHEECPDLPVAGDYGVLGESSVTRPVLLSQYVPY